MAIEPDDRLSRFVFNSKHVRADGSIKHQAFLPAPDGDTSVFRTTDLTQDQVWEIADAYVTPVRLQPVKGSAAIYASSAANQGLTTILSEPPPEHVNISNWPGSHTPTDDEKARRKQIAQKLAEDATWNPK